MNKKVYAYNVIWGESNERLLQASSPSTVDFYVHKKFIQAGYTGCMWLDECEYIFPSDVNMNAISALYEPGDDYTVFENKIRELGFEVIDVTTDCDILA